MTNGILWNESITKSGKFNIYGIMVKNMMLLECETWMPTERSRRVYWKLQGHNPIVDENLS